MSARKLKGATSSKAASFFSAQLNGEMPLTFATARRLYEMATALVTIRPWDLLGDSELFLVEDPISRQTCYCSVMGALGEVFSLHVYVGDESYRFLRKLLDGKSVTADDFYATHTGVSVEYVQSSEVTPPDRELLRAFRHPSGRGVASPLFRAFRSGYYPWYPTEPEGVTLAACMNASLALSQMLLSDASLAYWNQCKVYPYMRLIELSGRESEYAIDLRKIDDTPRSPLPSPALDEVRLRRILENDHSIGGILETDYFQSGTAMGGVNERKWRVPVALVADAGNGFLFRPELGGPGQTPADLLSLAILNAIEELRCVPEEIRVNNDDFREMIRPLTQRLAIAVSTANSLPAVREAKKALLAHMRR